MLFAAARIVGFDAIIAANPAEGRHDLIDDIMEILARRFAELVGRASGPMNFRLVVMPLTVTFLAIRAGLRDAREHRPAFLWTILTNPIGRRQAIRTAIGDIGRVFIFALVLDLIYQTFVLDAFRPLEMIIMAVTCAVVPYAIIRGPVTRLARACRRHDASKADEAPPAAAGTALGDRPKR